MSRSPRCRGRWVDFDHAIAEGLEFARLEPGTLVLVVSDHETGGLSLVMCGDAVTARYPTGGHTGEMTPHFAFGAGAERFGGILDNDEIGRMLVEIVRSWR
jgi:alkaline phosphatase